MKPALLIASFVLGLILPAILKPDLPRDLPPLAVVIDNMARLSAFVVSLGLLGFIAAVEISEETWSVNYLSIAALLALWTLALLGGPFFILGWHRLRLSLGGATKPVWPTPTVAAGLHFITMLVAGAIGLSLVVSAMAYPDSTSDDLGSWLAGGSLTVWALILAAAWGLHRYQVWQEGFLPSSVRLARALETERGAWHRVAVVAAADEPTNAMTAAIWVQSGQWFWRAQDVRQLIRFRNAAATRAAYPTIELHGRRVSFCEALGPKGRRPWPRFGVHVLEQRSGLRGRSGRDVPFQVADFGDLPSDAWGLLVPVDASTLRSVGLIAKIEAAPSGSTAKPTLVSVA